MIYYAIYRNGKYLQGIEPNENYSLGKAPTMGNNHAFSEFNTIWGNAPMLFEPLTAASYIKVLFEEYRWNDKEAKDIKILPIVRD